MTAEAATPENKPAIYSYSIVNAYPHDPQAFTQGLFWHEGKVYEGTGKLGRSSIRRVHLATGQVEQRYDCPRDIFGEGITIFAGTLYQLTWKNRKTMLYRKDDFSIIKTLEYPHQGWGLTHDTDHLIASDGSSVLYFLEPETLAEQRRITVREANWEVHALNELEYIDGRIYANVYGTDRIAIINPQDGLVEGWIDLTGLRQGLGIDHREAVLNGIMHDPQQDKLFVTGKYWPTLFEIRLVRRE
ncbi:MAG: glutaminyl-peptide cyclotransferase [Desulforhopalus sp.]|nr:glutaminyl-peptide cyclotransferase [Desulforhopalus sp.]